MAVLVEVTRRHREARAAVAGAYLVQGLCFAAVLTQVPALKQKFGFTDGELALILLAVPVVAGGGSLLAGLLAPRLGSRPVLRVAGLGVCAAMVGIGLAGIAGALATAAADRLDLALPVALGVVAAVGAAIALTVGPFLLPMAQERSAISAARGRSGAEPEVKRPEPGGTAPDRLAAPGIPWRPIVLIGVAVMVMYIAESATSNWSAVYLRDELHAGRGVPALGLAAYLTCQVAGRLRADRVVQRFGAARTVAAGGLVGMAGMALVAVAPTPWLGIVGFASVGAGLCVVLPLSFTPAGTLDPTGSGVAIARVNLFNYAGFVVGAALIGIVAEAAGRRWAFAVPAGLVVLVVMLARSFQMRAAR